MVEERGGSLPLENPLALHLLWLGISNKIPGLSNVVQKDQANGGTISEIQKTLTTRRLRIPPLLTSFTSLQSRLDIMRTSAVLSLVGLATAAFASDVVDLTGTTFPDFAAQDLTLIEFFAPW